MRIVLALAALVLVAARGEETAEPRAKDDVPPAERPTAVPAAEPGFSGSGRGNDRVDVTVTYDDGSIQAWVDEEYGAGLVRVPSALVPA